MTYRVGRSLGRTVYEVLGDDPKLDRFIGIMDTPALAGMVVTALNGSDGMADELRRLRDLVGEEGQEGWDGCSREEAIRQANYFHAQLQLARDELRKIRERSR